MESVMQVSNPLEIGILNFNLVTFIQIAFYKKNILDNGLSFYVSTEIWTTKSTAYGRQTKTSELVFQQRSYFQVWSSASYSTSLKNLATHDRIKLRLIFEEISLMILFLLAQ